jgi:hypothetical protein
MGTEGLNKKTLTNVKAIDERNVAYRILIELLALVLYEFLLLFILISPRHQFAFPVRW